jgi:hypothetical protein
VDEVWERNEAPGGVDWDNLALSAGARRLIAEACVRIENRSVEEIEAGFRQTPEEWEAAWQAALKARPTPSAEAPDPEQQREVRRQVQETIFRLQGNLAERN